MFQIASAYKMTSLLVTLCSANTGSQHTVNVAKPVRFKRIKKSENFNEQLSLEFKLTERINWCLKDIVLEKIA